MTPLPHLLLSQLPGSCPSPAALPGLRALVLNDCHVTWQQVGGAGQCSAGCGAGVWDVGVGWVGMAQDTVWGVESYNKAPQGVWCCTLE